MTHPSGCRRWLLALSLFVWLGCESDLRPPLPPASTETVSHEQPRPAQLPVQERHCELILLNPSPTPTVEASADVASPVSSSAALPLSAAGTTDPSQEPPGVKEFRRLHREIPPAVVRAIRDNHFRNYSVHIAQIRDDYYAVRYFEYVGQDFAVDMASLEHDPDYRQWRNQWEACQVTLLPLSDNQWWAPLKEIGHID